MAAESNLIIRVNRPLRDIFNQSMTGATTTHGGIVDRYYDGPRRDLWVEFKARKSMPRDGLIGGVSNKGDGKYRTLQFEWMCRRWRNCLNAGQVPNVIGVIGLPNNRAVIQIDPGEWEHGSPADEAVPISEVSAWIRSFTTGP